MHLLELAAEHADGGLAVPQGFPVNAIEDGFKVVEQLQKRLTRYAETPERECWVAIQSTSKNPLPKSSST